MADGGDRGDPSAPHEPGDETPRFDVARVLVWCAAIALVAGAVVAAFLLPDDGDAPPPERDPAAAQTADEEPAPPPPPTTGLHSRAIGRIPDVAAVERSGREMRTADLTGRFAVFDFVFSSCAGTCPPLQAAMRRLQAATGGQEDLRLVSVTVDPPRDTPERLREWADSLGADPARWLFLRAEEPDVRRLMQEGLKVPAGDDLVTHSNLFVLTDPDGAVRGRYSPLEHENWLDVLLADLATLRRERSAR